MREAKTHDVLDRRGDEAYEARGARPGRRRARRPGADRARSPASWPRIAPDARVNSSARSCVQLTMPGRARRLPGLRAGRPVPGRPGQPPAGRLPRRRGCWPRSTPARTQAAAGPAASDAEKLLVTSRALRLRRDHPDWFAGELHARWPPRARPPGTRSPSPRGGQARSPSSPGCPAGLRRRGGWADTALPLPERHWRDVLTGVRHAGLRPPPGRADQTAAGGAARPGPGRATGLQEQRRRQRPVTSFSVWAPAAGRVERCEVAGQRVPDEPADADGGLVERGRAATCRPASTTGSGWTAASCCPTRARRGSRSASRARAAPTTTPPSRWTDARLARRRRCTAR